MKDKFVLKLACMGILLSMCSLSACGSQEDEPMNEYGIFIGINLDSVDIS